MRYPVLKSLLCTAIGAVPGLLIYVNTEQTFGLVVAVLGGVIGLGLSLPGTSLSRVAGLTAGMFAVKNLPGPLGSKAWDKLVMDSAHKYGKEAARKDFRKLQEVVDVLTITDSAAERLRASRRPEHADSPLRMLATINEEHPHFLKYSMFVDTQWEPERDLYLRANGIDMVIDILSAKRIHGTVLDWQEEGGQAGLKFNNPHWPRERLDKEPWEMQSPAPA